jgi:GNAT superfamily N-acetyltransferase
MSPLKLEPTPPTFEQLERFLGSWPFRPGRWREADGLDPLLLDRVQHTLSEDGVRAWSVIDVGRLTAFATLRPLAWDSRVLAIAAARLEVFADGAYAEVRRATDALLAAIIQEAGRQDLRHISVRVDAADDAVIHGLEANAFLNVDALMTFGAAVEDLPRPAPRAGLSTRLAGPGDAGPVSAIAAAAFRDGRFHSDPSVPPGRASEVYRQWAVACCEGSAAEATIVAEDDTGPVGFVACRVVGHTAVHLQRATGTIALIASRESVRGRGVGLTLIAAATQWFRDEGVAAVEVGTQLRNVAAARLYERCGFRLVAGSLSFRLMIQP